MRRHNNMPEFNFPTGPNGAFESPDDAKIKEIASECGVAPHLVTKSPDGEWLVQGFSVAAYKELFEIGEGERRDLK